MSSRTVTISAGLATKNASRERSTWDESVEHPQVGEEGAEGDDGADRRESLENGPHALILPYVVTPAARAPRP